jgi:hypothetical protein
MSSEVDALLDTPHAPYDRMQALNFALDCASDILGAVGRLCGGLVIFEEDRVSILGPNDGESWVAFENRAADLVTARVPYAIAALHPCKATEADYTVSVEHFADGRGLYRLTVVAAPPDPAMN